jgi:predicted murein hydrolase (TIGR00659 family)
MNDMLWAVGLTIGVYIGFYYLQDRFKITLLNPLLLSSTFIIIFLCVFHIDYPIYQEDTALISFFIGPATVSLALPLYEKLPILKKHWQAIIAILLIGVIVHALTIASIVFLLNSADVMIATFIPKSVTTPIAMAISQSLGGIEYLTVVIVVLTGVLGILIAPPIFKLFNITSPMARGLSLGATAHAVGTTKAIEYGQIDASVATLSLIITGLLTVAFAPLIYQLLTMIV